MCYLLNVCNTFAPITSHLRDHRAIWLKLEGSLCCSLTFLKNHFCFLLMVKRDKIRLISYPNAYVSVQVSSYEDAGDPDEEKYMMDAPCMKNLIQLTGLQRVPRKKGVTIRGGGAPKPKKTVTATYTLATTTTLVNQIFEECFSDQVILRLASCFFSVK